MTTDEVKAAFAASQDEFLRFAQISKPRHRRPDICAFLMLDDLLPGDMDMVAAAEHDIFYLAPSLESFSAVATPEIIRDLARCGVILDIETDSLAMFA